MKKFTTIATTLLVLVTLTTFAAGEDGKNNRATITAPEFVWGEPVAVDTVNFESVNLYPELLMSLPVFEWGSPEEITEEIAATENAAVFTLSFPDFEWGTPEDVQIITPPAFVWGTPETLPVIEN